MQTPEDYAEAEPTEEETDMNIESRFKDGRFLHSPVIPSPFAMCRGFRSKR